MRFLKRLIITPLLLDNLVMQKLKRIFPHKHRITGKCKQCGQCCMGIHLTLTKRQMDNEFFRNLCIRWLSWLYDFILLEVDMINHHLVFTCKHLGENGKCQNYFWRYNICRNYPLLDYFNKPVFLPDCGYKRDAPSGRLYMLFLIAFMFIASSCAPQGPSRAYYMERLNEVKMPVDKIVAKTQAARSLSVQEKYYLKGLYNEAHKKWEVVLMTNPPKEYVQQEAANSILKMNLALDEFGETFKKMDSQAIIQKGRGLKEPWAKVWAISYSTDKLPARSD